jgi:hypothetical protein
MHGLGLRVVFLYSCQTFSTKLSRLNHRQKEKYKSWEPEYIWFFMDFYGFLKNLKNLKKNLMLKRLLFFYFFLYFLILGLGLFWEFNGMF